MNKKSSSAVLKTIEISLISLISQFFLLKHRPRSLDLFSYIICIIANFLEFMFGFHESNLNFACHFEHLLILSLIFQFVNLLLLKF